MTDATPRFEQAPAPQGSAVRLLGEWTAAQFGRPGLARGLRRSLPAPAANHAWELREAEQLDHVAQFSSRPPPSSRLGWYALFLAFGGKLLAALEHVRSFVTLIGQLTLD